MDLIAHGLTGTLIGYAGYRQQAGRAALCTAAVAALFPDVDAVFLPSGMEAYLRYHRTFTHSIIMLPVFATLLAGLFWLLSGRKNFRWLFGAATAGLASHLFLDWITNYGTELFWPISGARFSLSWVFIVDVYVWALLLAGVVTAVWTQRAAVARILLATVGAYLLACGGSHALTLRQARERFPDSRVAAYAEPLHPWRWTIVREEPTGGVIHWISRDHNETFVPYADPVLLAKAETTETVKLFRSFAEFPLVEQRKERGQTVLRYRDLRFRSPMPGGKVREGTFVVAKVVFDATGEVIAAGLGAER